jgi:hypothetical protein
MLKDKENSQKSREQKFHEFFEVLQLEYIVAELRYRIYPDGFRKEKSLEIMKMKKEKIFDIAIRNRMDTIFEDICMGCNTFYSKKLKDDLYNRVYSPEGGLPNFIYRDDKHKSQLEGYDIKFYYKKDVFFETPSGRGVLVDYDIQNDNFYIRCHGEVLTFSSNQIKRIFEK